MIRKVNTCLKLHAEKRCTITHRISSHFTGELNGNRAVPFRLTPNLSELITEIGICGPLIASMIATARCFSYPNFKLQTILRALLRDEMITSYKRVIGFIL